MLKSHIYSKVMNQKWIYRLPKFAGKKPNKDVFKKYEETRVLIHLVEIPFRRCVVINNNGIVSRSGTR